MKATRKLLPVLLALTLALSALPGLSMSAAAVYKTGDAIRFGTYPQSRVTGSALLAGLNSVLQSSDWKSYRYYSGSGSGWGTDGNMTAKDYMRYADIVYKEQKYRAVTFDTFRPWATTMPSNTSGDSSFQDDNGFACNTVYWFKYEPLQWRVLDPATGFVLCEKVIDAQPFNNYVRKDGTEAGGGSAYWGSAGKQYYANNYTYSSIRTWLTNDFYNTAFSAGQKSNILSTNVNNTGTHGYSSAETRDKVFLLSEAEAKTAAYGFTSTVSATDTRSAYRTDYSTCQGPSSDVGVAKASWTLRTGGLISSSMCAVSRAGYIDTNVNTYYTNIGIRPAMRLSTLKDDAALNLPTYYRAAFFADGSLVSNVLYLPGAKSITEPAVPSKTGFEGKWSGYTLDGNIRVNAVYTPRIYTLKWIMDDVTTTAKVPFGNPVSIYKPADPVKPGYRFSGWRCSDGTTVIPATMPAKDLTFTAQFSKITITDIKITKLPTKTVYTYRNDKEIDLSGMELEAICSDGTKQTITDLSAVTATGYSAKPRGEKTITVEYAGVQAEPFTVTVKYVWWQWLILIFLLGFIWY